LRRKAAWKVIEEHGCVVGREFSERVLSVRESRSRFFLISPAVGPTPAVRSDCHSRPSREVKAGSFC